MAWTYKDYKESDAVKSLAAQVAAAKAAVPTSYESKYGTQLADVMGKIENRRPFSYDFATDPMYKQYRDAYERQGKLAMADTMGQAAALTGGYGNSYATAAGQQAYNQYMQKASDVIPELYQLAADRYDRETSDLYNRYSLYSDVDASDYARHRDTVSDRQAALDRLLSEYQTERSYDYGKYSDDRTLDYNKYVSDRDYNEGVRQFNAQMAAKSSSGGSSSGGSTKSNGSGSVSLWTLQSVNSRNGQRTFLGSNGKSATFDEGVNPYTGTINKDINNGAFNNGYQPNNIGGVKLKDSGQSYVQNGRTQKVWKTEQNGTTRYWVWDGTANEYFEVEPK